jgi:hypothetical protein
VLNFGITLAGLVLPMAVKPWLPDRMEWLKADTDAAGVAVDQAQRSLR